MNNNPIVLLERTNIFPCQTCSRAFLRQNDLDKHVARFNHVNQDGLVFDEFKPPVLRPLPGSDNESADYILQNVTRAQIHKKTSITKNKDKKSLLLHACTSSKTDSNGKNTSDNALKSETKLEKNNQTEERECKEMLVKIKIEPNVAARLKDRSNSIRADITPIIPNDSVKQELKDNHSNKIHSIEDCEKNVKPLTCGQCPKSFKTIAGITNHLQTHFKPTYQCSHCPKAFATAQKLSKHVSNSHKHRDKVQCHVCQKEIKNSTNLKIHLRTHTGERPFPCKQCGKRFTQAASLYTHSKIHSGIKNHICSYCNKAFTDYHNMKNHETIHTNERPNVCRYCNKAFSDPSALRRHIRTHTGSKIYQCPLCPMKFSDASGLIAHKKRHSGKKDFACNYCGKKFFSRSERLKHETAVHLKTNDFECELCKKRFALKQYLRLHIINNSH